MKRPDKLILKDIKDELKWSPFLSDSDILVSVKDGYVILSGTTLSDSRKLAAEKVAKEIAGVKKVVLDIKVDDGEAGQMSEEDIMEDNLIAFEWHSIIS